MASNLSDAVKATLDGEDQIRRDTIVEERTGVLNLARRSREGTAVQVRAGNLSADEAGLIDRAVLLFAEQVAIGFHVAGETDAEVRAKLREVVNMTTASVEAAGQ